MTSQRSSNLETFYSYGSANHNTDGNETLSEDETNWNEIKITANKNAGKLRTKES